MQQASNNHNNNDHGRGGLKFILKIHIIVEFMQTSVYSVQKKRALPHWPLIHRIECQNIFSTKV
jgi:hypothetical protein